MISKKTVFFLLGCHIFFFGISQGIASSETKSSLQAQKQEALEAEGEAEKEGPEEPSIVEHLDLLYFPEAEAHERHKLDIYMPEGVEKAPVLVFFHGGAWIMGGKGQGKRLQEAFCQEGYGVVSINYRLANPSEPEKGVQYPDFVDDASAALNWVYKHIAEYQGNPEQLFVIGHSAGAHIGACLATNETFLASHGLENHSLIKGFIGISGVYQIPFGNPFIDAFFNTAFPHDEAIRKEASPMHHADSLDPPSLLLYAEEELPFIDTWAIAFQSKLEKAEVAVKIQEVKGEDHESVYKKLKEKKGEAYDAILSFLEEHTSETGIQTRLEYIERILQERTKNDKAAQKKKSEESTEKQASAG